MSDDSNNDADKNTTIKDKDSDLPSTIKIIYRMVFILF